jgi:nucleotide-binding universal stress UspA family protein
MDKHRVLVIGSRTVDSPDLVDALRRRGAVESARVTLLVPAVPSGLSWAADMKAGYGEAIDKADVAATQIRSAGIELEETIVGDPDPLAAAGDSLHARDFDEVVVATPPPGLGGWLRPSLAERVRRQTALPVAELVIEPQQAPKVPYLVAPLGAAS